MLPTHAFAESLAHWRYAPDQWRDFVALETKSGEKLLRTYRNFLVAVGIVACLMIALLILMFLRPGYALKANFFAPVFAVVVVAGICFLAVALYRRAFRQKLARLCSQPGEVYITRTEVNVNGVSFDWNYGEFGWHLDDVSRQTVTTEAGGKMEFLEFKCKTDNKGSRNTRNLSKSQRVPVPAGREPEADRIVERLLLAARHN